MDSLNFNPNIKVEKGNGIRRISCPNRGSHLNNRSKVGHIDPISKRNRRLEKITAVFKFIEVCIFLIILTRFPTQLPSVPKVSGEFFRGLTASLISPRFVFVLANVILVVLLIQSGQFATKEGDKNVYKVDLYDEYMKNCRTGHDLRPSVNVNHSHRPISRRRNLVLESQKQVKTSYAEDIVSESKKQVKASYVEDEMSSEEFKQTIEAFIARQQRILRENELPSNFPL